MAVRPGESMWFEVHVNPLVGADNTILGVSVVFHDVTAARRLLEDLEHANRQLESAYDELQTVNDALRERTGELDRVNDFLESILTSLRAGVIVLDVQMRVPAWNRGAEELRGVRRDEAEGEHLLNLDIGLPVADLRPVVRSALSDGTFMEEVKLSAVNRRGREVVIRVVCSSLRANGGEPDGAILVMEQQER
ncbi:PAS domain-containing protein [Lentzea rhizosphaerae]|uniref:PAS domain-containing protein n=1 Tax=Lentzea rhizosphaerae TaxID=2041025 RepID=A0ABV8C4D3_9PSEU